MQNQRIRSVCTHGQGGGGISDSSAFRIATSRRSNPSPSREVIQSYRWAFAEVRLVSVDEVSTIGAGLRTPSTRVWAMSAATSTIHLENEHCLPWRQVPVATLSLKPPCDSVDGATLWHSLEFNSLTRIMRHPDFILSAILTEVGNGDALVVEALQGSSNASEQPSGAMTMCPPPCASFIETAMSTGTSR